MAMQQPFDVAAADATLDQIMATLDAPGASLGRLIAGQRPSSEEEGRAAPFVIAPRSDETTRGAAQDGFLQSVSGQVYFSRFKEWPGNYRTLRRYALLV